jgi:hypothetical protein
MRTNEHDANLSLQPVDRKPIEPRAIEHYRPGGGRVLVKWCAGVVAAGALLGFVAGALSAWFGG